MEFVLLQLPVDGEASGDWRLWTVFYVSLLGLVVLFFVLKGRLLLVAELALISLMVLVLIIMLASN